MGTCRKSCSTRFYGSEWVEITSCEEKLAELEIKIETLMLQMQENTSDFVKLGELQAEIDLLNDEKDETEMTLLEAMEELESL